MNVTSLHANIRLARRAVPCSHPYSHFSPRLDLAIPSYIVYCLPAAESPLMRTIASWLGRDLSSGRPCGRRPLDGLTAADHSRLVAPSEANSIAASLTAPFRLSAHTTENQLIDSLRRLTTQPPLLNARFKLIERQRSLALGLSEPQPALCALHVLCTQMVETISAPATRAGVQWRQLAHSPHAVEAFHQQFYIPLTARIPNNAVRQRVADLLHAVFEPVLSAAQTLDGFTLSLQPDGAGPVLPVHRFGFAGSVRRSDPA